jgi:hypothetical protein
MSVGIGASGFVGIGIETTPNTYAVPTKFFPIRSESLTWNQSTSWRRVIRGTTDVIGAVAGNGSVEGDIDMELLDDVLPYFLLAARGDLTKTGAAAPFEYEFLPSHDATPEHTLSVTVVRNGEVFGYVGVVVSSMTFSADEVLGTVTFSLLGTNEETQALPTPVYNDNDSPFGAGTWKIEVPTAQQIYDADNFSFEIDDSGEVQFRLKDELGAQFVKYGERNMTISLDRDFHDRSEYEAFKLLTKKSITVQVSKDGGDRLVRLTTPAAIIDTHELSLSSVGDLVRASITYQGVHDASTGGSYKINIKTDEDLVEV